MFNLEGKKVLVVDDYKENIDILVESLIENYQVFIALNGLQALEIAEQVLPDIILLDIMMPVMDGYEALSALKDNAATKEIPVILVSALNEIGNKKKGFELGAVDYITKPFEMIEVAYRVNIHLNLREAARFLENQNRILEERVQERTLENENLRDVMIETLAAIAETRDTDTGEHIHRTQQYIVIIAEQLRQMGYYKEHITDEYLKLLFKTSPLHDVGKVGIPDNILLKPGKLTTEEFEIMKTHTYLGHKALRSAQGMVQNSAFINLAAELAYSHHEKWDGTGYPEGLKGETIPLSGRLMALVDVYDALVSERIYKGPMPHETAKALIIEGKGKHFQPEIVEAFLAAEEAFLKVKAAYE